MAEEIDDNGFYCQDFSTKSTWEVFNAQLGEVLLEWNVAAPDITVPLDKDQLFKANWDVKTAKVPLGKQEFTVNYYEAVFDEKPETVTAGGQKQLFSDLLNLNNTFWPPEFNDAHLLARWFGIRRFVVIHPTGTYVSNPAECSFFMSSTTVVATETKSAVPIFVPVFNPAWNFYLGVWVGESVRINFDVVALEVAPTSCKFLSGLMFIFKEKMKSDHEPATVSVRQTYNLGNMTKYMVRMKVPFFVNPAADPDLYIEEGPMEGTFFVALPSGYFSDSTTELLVHCTWPEMCENMVIDTANYTDLVPMKAHTWSVRIIGNVNSYLTSALDDYLNLHGSKQTVEGFVGGNYGNPLGSGDEPNPLEQLTKTKFVPSASPLRKWSPQKKLAGPIKHNELKQMMGYLFPDMQKDSLYPYNASPAKNKPDCLRIKSTGSDSLVSRLSCLLATINSHFGGRYGMAQMWANFTMELRYRVDNCIQIPGVASGYPDMRTCLLNQKLQMLNVCMGRRRVRECGLPFGVTEKTVKTVGGDDEGELTEEDDEFFDCSDDESNGAGGGGVTKPQGRQSRLGELKLIDSDEYLYVPATQEPVPKTEDQLQDDAEVMLKLGPGSGLSTQMMCSSLKSDMESFKAANPKGKIEDFIRWYSPRDWEEETDENGKVTGKLSVRMTAPDNTWQSVWKQAQPVPAYRQKRLFDDTIEAQKVLHYLESRTIGDIFGLTVITLFHSALLKIKDVIAYSNIMEVFKDRVDDILADLCRFSRDSQPEVSMFDVIKKIEELETTLFEYKNLERLFTQSPPSEKEKEVLSKLIEKEEVNLPGGAHNYFARRIMEKCRVEIASSDSDEIFPAPTSKEYVIRIDCEEVMGGPHFLRAIVSGQRVRLCGAFSENTTFV